MGRTLNEKLSQLPQPRREKIERRAAELTNEELSLRELRRALGRTQTKIASSLKVGQDTVARYEQRSDMLLSTLGRYIAAAGGKLSLIAEFPGRPSVRLKGIGDIASKSRTVSSGPHRRERTTSPNRLTRSR
jgi:DNA-binding XRE family transcriptional regulator